MNTLYLKLLLFACFCYLPVSAFATIKSQGLGIGQRQAALYDSLFVVKGSIVDEMGASISSVNIVLYNILNKQTQNYVSKKDGSFFFNNIAPGRYYLKVSFVGFLPYTKEILVQNHAVNLGALILKKNNQQLQEVKIQAKRPLIVRKVDRTVINISNQIRQVGGTALDAIKIVPGVRVTNDKISIAGKGTVLIMLNDRLINMTEKELSEYLSTIPGESIDKIEIITNPPAKYDALGNTGYLNIVLKKNLALGFNGALTGKIGQAMYNFGGGSASFNYNSQKISINLSPSFNHSKPFTWSEQKNFLPEVNWNQKDTSVSRNRSVGLNYNIKYKISPSTHVALFYNYAYNKSSSQSTNLSVFTNRSTNSFDSLLNTRGLNNSKTESHIIDLSGNTKLNKNVKLIVDFNYFNRRQPSGRSFQTGSVTNYNSLPSVYDTVRSNNFQDINVFLSSADIAFPILGYNISAGSKFTFINSTNHSNYSALSSFINAQNSLFRYLEDTQAAYVTISKENKKWSYQLGLRGEYTQAKGNSLSLNEVHEYKMFKIFPTGFVNFKTSEINSFSLSYGKRIVRPGYGWVNPFRFYSSINSYQEGNPYLKPYYTHNLEFIHIYKDMITSSVYLNSTKNKFDQLTIQNQQGNHLFQGIVNRNFLNEISIGISENFTYSPFSWFETTNQASLYKTHVKSNTALTVPSMDGVSCYLSTDNTIKFKKSGILVANIAFWYQFPEISGMDKVKAYYSLDGGISAKLFKNKVTCTVALCDLLKTSSPSWDSKVNDISQSYYQYYDNRYVRIALTYKFAKGKDKDNGISKQADEWNRALY